MERFVCHVFTRNGHREEVEHLMERYDFSSPAQFIPASEPTGLLHSRHKCGHKKRKSFSGYLMSEYGYEYNRKTGDWGTWANPEARFESCDIAEHPLLQFPSSHACAESAAFVTPEGEWHEADQRPDNDNMLPFSRDTHYEQAWQNMIKRAQAENLFITEVEYYI